MNYRFMRMLVFFDLPTLEAAERREYIRFRKFLIKSGFLMLQESVYCKLLLNGTAAEIVAESIRKNKPSKGVVQMLTVTEKQYARMELIQGENQSLVIDSDERLVII